jgi:hypothetical protein
VPEITELNPGAGGPFQFPDYPGMQQNALASQMMQLKLQDAMRQQQARNVLAQPGALMQQGGFTPQAMQQVAGIDPQLYMDLQDRQAMQEQRQLLVQERQQRDKEAKQKAHDNMVEPIARAYEEDRNNGLSEQAALNNAKQMAQQSLDEAQWGGVLSDQDIRTAKEKVDSWTPQTLENMYRSHITDQYRAGERAERRMDIQEGYEKQKLGLEERRLKLQENVVAGRTSTGGLTDDSIDQAAEQLINGDQEGAFRGVAYGLAGNADRQKIRNRAAQMAKEQGISGGEIVARRETKKANSAALSQATKAESNISTFADNLEGATGVMLDLAKKVDNSGVPTLNRWVNAGRMKVAGDPDVTALDMQVKTVRDEFTKMMLAGNTLGATGTLADRQELDSAFSSANTLSQLQSVADTVRKDRSIRIKSFRNKMGELRRRIASGSRGFSEEEPQAESGKALSADELRAMSKQDRAAALAAMTPQQKAALRAELGLR